MYYGKQIYENENFALISSSLPLPFSDNLISLTKEEYDILSQEDKEKRIALKNERRKEKGLKVEIVEPDQPIEIEDDEEFIEEEGTEC